MDRRSFLRGLVIGSGAAVAAPSTTALVRLATARDVESLVRAQHVNLAPVDDLTHPGAGLFGGPVYMQDARGRFLPIGYVTQCEIAAPVDEWMSWTGEVAVVPGIQRASLRFEGQY